MYPAERNKCFCQTARCRFLKLFKRLEALVESSAHTLSTWSLVIMDVFQRSKHLQKSMLRSEMMFWNVFFGDCRNYPMKKIFNLYLWMKRWRTRGLWCNILWWCTSQISISSPILQKNLMLNILRTSESMQNLIEKQVKLVSFLINQIVEIPPTQLRVSIEAQQAEKC